ncbi:11391_t:CDS:2 [Entrophospora sp. SA101]|nr:1659_t:CDS:2 [Entrophospora sp. SA101]CAJ0893902.1 11391_t:CDS:2 [Entrophospora sp. SA101]
MFNVALKDLAEPIRGKFKNNETVVPSQTSTLAIKGTSTALIEAGAVFQFVTSFQGTAQNIVNIEFCTVFSLTCMSIYN